MRRQVNVEQNPWRGHISSLVINDSWNGILIHKPTHAQSISESIVRYLSHPVKEVVKPETRWGFKLLDVAKTRAVSQFPGSSRRVSRTSSPYLSTLSLALSMSNPTVAIPKSSKPRDVKPDEGKQPTVVTAALQTLFWRTTVGPP